MIHLLLDRNAVGPNQTQFAYLGPFDPSCWGNEALFADDIRLNLGSSTKHVPIKKAGSDGTKQWHTMATGVLGAHDGLGYLGVRKRIQKSGDEG